MKHEVTQPEAPRQVHDAQGLALKLDPNGVALIRALNGICRPSHISRLIVAVRVNAVNRVLGGRARPNISQELREGGDPCWMHLHASRAVVSKGSVIRIRASSFHSQPNAIFRWSLGVMGGHAVSVVGIVLWLRSFAGHVTGAATGRRASRQVPQTDSFLKAAFAPALSAFVVTDTHNRADDGPLAERITNVDRWKLLARPSHSLRLSVSQLNPAGVAF